MLNSYLYDNECIEDTSYNNEVYLLNDVTSKKKIKRKKQCKYLCFFFQILTILYILGLQIICFLYLNYIIKEIEQLNINNVNITKTINYINKTETIIDFVCDNYIKC